MFLVLDERAEEVKITRCACASEILTWWGWGRFLKMEFPLYKKSVMGQIEAGNCFGDRRSDCDTRVALYRFEVPQQRQISCYVEKVLVC